ncbi:tripartite-type tricarboxylate transporter receptor subunit TctC [Humitalea rosea]|uniref:Tripartite-type tricarboxylate transporter receptor subunit TctC n=1 Tax=Humitalea rosea TaxID=990373 RepID=A0A2W7KQP5_9PROT|nr:tripartite tricarboxylate transporter substrate binding protein [Humitalea rosea]PZW50910.1 tripartite-type tricarboxylate transporter receptor subunit TctC [Humitalea rosea]
MMQRRLLLATAATLAATRGAWAQDRFPNRPMRIVVPFSAGGSTDILSRICAQLMTEGLGQPTVVDNITGAGGTLGAGRVLEAAADGYTLMAGTPGPVTINPQLLPHITYDPRRDFAPVIFVGESPAVVVVRNDSPLRSIQDLVARAKAAPGTLTYASAGIGSFAHLSGALFEWRAGVQMIHVSYRGTAPAATDIIGGRVDVMFENYPSVQGYITSGAFRTLAIGAERPSALLPGVPTVASQGVPGYVSSSWFGLFARAGAPPAALQALNAAINAGLRKPETAQRLAAMGVEPVGGTPESFGSYIAQRYAETGELIRTAHITVD